MFCRNCGKEIPDWAEFCPECGSLVNKSNNESGMGESNNQKAFNSYIVIMPAAKIIAQRRIMQLL